MSIDIASIINDMSEKVQRLQTAKTNIATAITTKGGTVNSGDGFEDFSTDIATIPSGGGSINDVNFCDYDGTIIAAYSAADFVNLSALPPNPSHDGLTAQGWNWTIMDAKAYVAKYGKLNIGQMYTITDDKTRIHCHFEDGRLSPTLGLCPNGTVVVDWGDGSNTDTLTGTSLTTLKTQQHTYVAQGDYIITLSVISGTAAIAGASTRETYSHLLFGAVANRVYNNAIAHVEIGSNITIGSYAFANCQSLASVVISSGVQTIGDYAFQDCQSLVSVVIPDTVTALYDYAYNNCVSLALVSIPNSVVTFQRYMFRDCKSLRTVTLPDSIAKIYDYTFSGCSALTDVVIPDSVSEIALYAFSGCHLLRRIILTDSITTIGGNAFEYCYQLETIIIPSSVVDMGINTFRNCNNLRDVTWRSQISVGSYMFQNCVNLLHITLADGIADIYGYAFQNCSSLVSIVIPASVTGLGINGTDALGNCYGLSAIHFKSATPPAAMANTFRNLPTDCIIYVPIGTLAAYSSATNYPSSSTYTYREE